MVIQILTDKDIEYTNGFLVFSSWEKKNDDQFDFGFIKPYRPDN